MIELVRLCASFLAAIFKSRTTLQTENLALRHQLCVYQRSIKRPKVRPPDRILWSLLAKTWAGWKDALIFVKPDTVIRWQRKRFKEHWTRLSRSGEPGRPPVPDEVKELIRTLSSMNSTWGSPRIVGELAKLGITVTKSTVDKYRVRVRKPPSPTWRAFLKNHAKDIVSIDFLVVPTVRFEILYEFLFLSVDRRRIIHVGVTQHPSAAWAAQQVVGVHLGLLASLLKGKVQNIFTLRGGMEKKQRTAAMDDLRLLASGEPCVILATGRYAGEGFDVPRLDTLFLVMPISWRGTLQQYVGRLHRQHAGKRDVRVYDYVDLGVPMLQRMLANLGNELTPRTGSSRLGALRVLFQWARM